MFLGAIQNCEDFSSLKKASTILKLLPLYFFYVCTPQMSMIIKFTYCAINFII